MLIRHMNMIHDTLVLLLLFFGCFVACVPGGYGVHTWHTGTLAHTTGTPAHRPTDAANAQPDQGGQGRREGRPGSVLPSRGRAGHLPVHRGPEPGLGVVYSSSRLCVACSSSRAPQRRSGPPRSVWVASGSRPRHY